MTRMDEVTQVDELTKRRRDSDGRSDSDGRRDADVAGYPSESPHQSHARMDIVTRMDNHPSRDSDG